MERCLACRARMHYTSTFPKLAGVAISHNFLASAAVAWLDRHAWRGRAVCVTPRRACAPL
eukprot:3034139-Pleurochrysis_carterae.AAC.1